MRDLRVQLASWPDMDDLVAEIWLGDQYVADVKADGDTFVVTFRSPGDAVPIQVELNDLKQALDEARRALDDG
jgi:hypothetical protein